MKRPIFCRLLPWFVIGFAAMMIMLAVGAGYIGADVDHKWGPFRVGILILGLAALFLLIGLKIVGAIDRRLMEKPLCPGLRSRFEMIVSRFTARAQNGSGPPESPEFPQLSKSDTIDSVMPDDGKVKEDQPAKKAIISQFVIHRRGIGIVVLFIAVELLYVWFVSVGHMTTWPDETNFYGMLAESFLKGQVALPLEPSPLLAGLNNPYSYAERSGISTPMDASYFDGKYYMYWGPAPAVILSAWELIAGQSLGDEQVVFLAVSTVFVFSTLILLYIQRRYFPSLPSWLLFLGIVIVATIHPLLWILNWPAIYHGAIASSQAFLVAGLFMALPVMDGMDRSRWRLLAVGTLFALAIGSRLSIVGSIAVLIASLILVMTIHNKEGNKFRYGIKVSTFLVLPIAVCLLMLAYYNYIRFGDVFETGFKYALTLNDLPQYLAERKIFNLAYVIPNIINYVFAPFHVWYSFPFVFPFYERITEFQIFLSRFRIPDAYFVEDITGSIAAAPSLLFSLYLAFKVICGPISFDVSSTRPKLLQNRKKEFRWTMGIMMLTACTAAIPMMVFFWVSSRYLFDVVPILAIPSVTGAWLLYFSTRGYPLRGTLAVLAILSAAIAGTVISLLLSLSGPVSRFHHLNPGLYETISNLFSPT